MSYATTEYRDHELVIFLGYPGDAVDTANTVLSAKSALQSVLDERMRSDRDTPLHSITIWDWKNGAAALVGGQQRVVDPQLRRADYAVFVFHESEGDLTQEEIAWFREQGEDGPPVVLLCPQVELRAPGGNRAPSALEAMRARWTANWGGPANRALVQLPPYRDLAHLRQLFLEQFRRDLPAIVARVRLLGQHRVHRPRPFPLPLIRAEFMQSSAPDLSITCRLVASVRATEFVESGPELARLRAWLDKDRRVSIALLTGPAGIGKTRLALELCERAEHDHGYQAGFASDKAMDDFGATSHQSPWEWDRDVLVIVDYAATRAAQIRRVLAKLSEQHGRHGDFPRRIRILLLERYGTTDGQWLDQALGRELSESTSRIPAWRDREADVEVGLIRPLESQVRFLQSAASSLCDGAALDDSQARAIARDLGEGNPLLLQLAAIIAVSRPRGRIGQRESLMKEIVLRQNELLAKAAKAADIDEELLRRLVLVVTIAGGVGRDHEGLRAAAGRPVLPSDIDALHKVLGNRDGKVRPMEPDLIAEHWVIGALGLLEQAQPGAATEFVALACRIHANEPLSFLVRTLQDLPDNALSKRLLLECLHDADHTVIGEVATALPAFVAPLVELCCDVQRRHVDALRRALAKSPTSRDLQIELARALCVLSRRLGTTGSSASARQAALEAIRLLRTQVVHDGTIKFDLASCLHQLAKVVRQEGRPDRARASFQQASDLFASLQAERAIDLARAECSFEYGECLLELQRLEAAAVVTAQAERLMEKYAPSRQADVTQDAEALTVLQSGRFVMARLLDAQGHPRQALSQLTRASRTLRQLRQQGSTLRLLRPLAVGRNAAAARGIGTGRRSSPVPLGTMPEDTRLDEARLHFFRGEALLNHPDRTGSAIRSLLKSIHLFASLVRDSPALREEYVWLLIHSSCYFVDYLDRSGLGLSAAKRASEQFERLRADDVPNHASDRCIVDMNYAAAKLANAIPAESLWEKSDAALVAAIARIPRSDKLRRAQVRWGRVMQLMRRTRTLDADASLRHRRRIRAMLHAMVRVEGASPRLQLAWAHYEVAQELRVMRRPYASALELRKATSLLRRLAASPAQAASVQVAEALEKVADELADSAVAARAQGTTLRDVVDACCLAAASGGALLNPISERARRAWWQASLEETFELAVTARTRALADGIVNRNGIVHLHLKRSATSLRLGDEDSALRESERAVRALDPLPERRKDALRAAIVDHLLDLESEVGQFRPEVLPRLWQLRVQAAGAKDPSDF